MGDHDRTKEQLIAELEMMREQLAAVEQAESQRKAALRLLSELAETVGDYKHSVGTWDWEPHKNKEIIAFYPCRENEAEYVTEDPTSRFKIVHPLFEGTWEEIVHPQDLPSLKMDLDFILSGKKRNPAFYFRTNPIPKVAKSIMATWCLRTEEEVVGGYIDPTRFMESLEILKKYPELSKRFREEQLEEFGFPKQDGELVVATMWDVLINQIFKDYPDMINVITATVLPYYERIKSDRKILAKQYESEDVACRFLSAAIRRDQYAVFMKWNGSYEFISPEFQRIFGIPESDLYKVTDEDLFQNQGSASFREIFFEHDMPVFSKLVKTKKGETGKELVLIQLPGEDPDYPYGSGWGLVCDPDEMEREAASSGRELEYESKAMRDALKKAGMAAKADTTVLITGETGSGKDYLAKHIHDHSKRADGPYFAINCAAIPPDLAESELFGHERGAFTGALQRKRGLLELAEGGTLLLNEIGELSPLLQSKLLTFLDTRQFTRVGGEKQVKVNARIIGATNRNLEADVQAGKFRSDLYYRINVLSIEVPPLRERLEDLPVLTRIILDELKEEMPWPIRPRLDSREMKKMMNYPWPGNVRELRNMLEGVILLLDNPRQRIKLPLSSPDRPAQHFQDRELTVRFPPEKKLEDLIKDIRRFYVDEALHQTGGNISKAARLLGVSRDLFYDLPNPPPRRKRRTK